MHIRGISRDLLDLLLSIGREQHPYEFAGVLREEGGIIHELNLLPGTTSNDHSARLFLDMMPLDTHIAGSAHSHPNGVLIPSDADLSFFPRVGGRYHCIVGYPYDADDWRFFSADGTPVDIEVVE
jgi:proteasome lid subunit RPN8/RPN11